MFRRHWWQILALFAGVALAFGSYLFFNSAPEQWRWPGAFAVDPTTLAPIEPLDGPNPFQTFVLKSWADGLVPFVPLMAIPYLSYLLIVPIGVPLVSLAAGNIRKFFTVMWALITAQLVMDVGYFFFQTWVERTHTAPNDFGGLLVGLVWGNDQPFNGFPSAHCAWTTIGIIALWRLRKRFAKTAWIAMAWLALIYPATVMLQQHYLIDVYAGILVGISAYSVTLVIIEKPRVSLAPA